VRIPSAIMAAARRQIDSKVDVREDGGRIIIEPVAPAEPNLDALLAAITPDKIHGEVSFGQPAGKEML